MFFAILSTFLGSLATVFWKKALGFGASKELFNLLSKSTLISIITILYIFGVLDFAGVTIYFIFLILLITVVGTLKTLLEQYVYSREKISTLMPYTNLNKILTIILSFFIFQDISLISLFITLLAIFIIAIFYIDFKSFKLPKNIGLFTLGECIQSVLTLIVGYILLSVTGSAFFVLTYIIGALFIGSIVAYKGQFSELKTLSIKFYMYRLTACHLGGTGFLLSVFVIKELGVSVSILLSFIGILMTLIFSFLILKDKPKPKDIIVTIIVTSLVGLGYFFK